MIGPAVLLLSLCWTAVCLVRTRPPPPGFSTLRSLRVHPSKPSWWTRPCWPPPSWRSSTTTTAGAGRRCACHVCHECVACAACPCVSRVACAVYVGVGNGRRGPKSLVVIRCTAMRVLHPSHGNPAPPARILPIMTACPAPHRRGPCVPAEGDPANCSVAPRPCLPNLPSARPTCGHGVNAIGEISCTVTQHRVVWCAVPTSVGSALQEPRPWITWEASLPYTVTTVP